MERILARLTHDSAELLSFQEVRQKLGATARAERGLRDIPLDGIVGSVGRYDDFTRSFLPLQASDAQRWARVEVAASSPSGLPPIEVYQIGEVYFVRDGHHRVSVAREFGATHIQAHVTEVRTKVSLSPDVKPDDLIVKAEYADFLEHTSLDEVRPDANLSVTVAGRYGVLKEHIDVHRYFMGLDQEREIPYEEAVTHWHDEVYLPVVKAVRQLGILRDFPGRTEADLYVWILKHRAELEEELEWEIETEEAASDLAAQFSSRPHRVLARMGENVVDAVIPAELDPGPSPGEWRREPYRARRNDRLFADTLVAVSGEQAGWCALEQALEVVLREEGRLRGLHVVATEDQRGSENVQSVRERFARRCKSAGVQGELAVEVGEVASTMCRRARWADLLVLSLTYPPGDRPLARLASGLRGIIQTCPVPVLTVTGVGCSLSRALLAYDGSPKADEALFVATYLSGQWDIPLVVVTVAKGHRDAWETLGRAEGYLEAHGVRAVFVEEEDRPAAAGILRVAEDRECDLIIMGGYGFSPPLAIVLGSTVDEVLRIAECPVLICR
jgi:nucleotide-binding universal stress UspA family protein